MVRVRLTLEPDDAICLESPYDPLLVEGLKRAIDYGGRQWEPSRKRWIISALYAKDLVRFLQSYGAQIQDDRQQGHPGALAPLPPMPTDLKEAFDALHLAYTAPLCVAEAAYRALSKYCHPDRGGEAQDFDRVASAITVVRSYLDPQEDADDDIPF